MKGARGNLTSVGCKDDDANSLIAGTTYYFEVAEHNSKSLESSALASADVPARSGEQIENNKGFQKIKLDMQAQAGGQLSFNIKSLSPLPMGGVSVGCPHVGAEVMTYDGFSAGSTTTFVPMLFKDAFGCSYTRLYTSKTRLGM